MRLDLLVSFIALMGGEASAPPALCGVVPVQGQSLYCCQNQSGQTCCAEVLAGDGSVAGCGCRP